MQNLIHYDLETGIYIGVRKNNLHYVDWKIKDIKLTIKNLTLQ